MKTKFNLTLSCFAGLLFSFLPLLHAVDTIATDKIPPVVIKTFPEAGASEIPSGPIEIRITFSKPVKKDCYTINPVDTKIVPEKISNPRLEADGRTFVMDARLKPNTTYGLWINGPRGGHFQDRNGVYAQPYQFFFKTSATAKSEEKAHARTKNADVIEKIKGLTRSREWDKALDVVQNVLKKSPDDPQMLTTCGTILLEKLQAQEGLPFLTKALKHADSDFPGLTLLTYLNLARAYYQIGDYEKCSQALQKIKPGALAETDDIANLLGLSDGYSTWAIVETDHIRFHFSPTITTEVREKFSKTREDAFQTVNVFFQAIPPKKIDFFVWSSSEEANKVAGFSQLGFANTASVVVHSRVDQTRGHELTHILCAYAVKPTRSTRLINEGIAVHYDLSDRDRLATAREAFQNSGAHNFSIVSLWQNSFKRTEDNLIYPIAGAFVERIHQKGGDEKFLQLCANQTYESAKNIYGSDLDAWIAEFEQDIAKS
ncbi:MAG: Ig-like domain-containing protein [Nibricoccus sp.]